MKYEKFMYLYPPRPENKISPDRLNSKFYDDWVCQVKKNGTCSVIFVPPDRKVFAMGRHNNPHKAWQFTSESRKFFEEIPGNSWYVFVAELLHSKTPHIKDTNYVHDMLVEDGELLLGKTYANRYHRLTDVMLRDGVKGTNHDHFMISKNTWLARNVRGKKSEEFARLISSEDEGLVLKKKDDILTLGNIPCQMVKCRRSHKNYSN